MEHTIEKTDTGFTCAICHCAWKNKPRSSCPGVIEYAWQQAPENLKTESQLKKLKLAPGPKRGIVGAWWLYDINEAIPWTPEEIAAEKERVKRMRSRKCRHCGREVDRRNWTERFEACNKCLPTARERYEREERENREALQRGFQEMLVESHDEVILWARDLMSRNDWVILDTETTGLEYYYDDVISVSIIQPDGTILLNTLIKPVHRISAEASQVNGITDQMVQDAPSITEIYPQIAQALDGKKVIAYNESFDRCMLHGTLRRQGIDLPEDGPISLEKGHHWDCAMLAYAAYVGEWSSYHRSFRWQKLPKGDHTAAGDCFAVLEIIKQMAEAKLSTEIDPVSDLVSPGARSEGQENHEYSS